MPEEEPLEKPFKNFILILRQILSIVGDDVNDINKFITTLISAANLTKPKSTDVRVLSLSNPGLGQWLDSNLWGWANRAFTYTQTVNDPDNIVVFIPNIKPFLSNNQLIIPLVQSASFPRSTLHLIFGVAASEYDSFLTINQTFKNSHLSLEFPDETGQLTLLADQSGQFSFRKGDTIGAITGWRMK